MVDTLSHNDIHILEITINLITGSVLSRDLKAGYIDRNHKKQKSVFEVKTGL